MDVTLKATLTVSESESKRRVTDADQEETTKMPGTSNPERTDPMPDPPVDGGPANLEPVVDKPDEAAVAVQAAKDGLAKMKPAPWDPGDRFTRIDQVAALGGTIVSSTPILQTLEAFMNVADLVAEVDNLGCNSLNHH